MPFANSALTDPGPLCRDQPATLTCNVTGGIILIWNYDFDGAMKFEIALINIPTKRFPPPDPVVTPDGVAIIVSLLMPTDIELVSQISFVPTDSMNGKVIECGGLNRVGIVVPAESVILHGKISLCAVCYQVGLLPV